MKTCFIRLPIWPLRVWTVSQLVILASLAFPNLGRAQKEWSAGAELPDAIELEEKVDNMKLQFHYCPKGYLRIPKLTSDISIPAFWMCEAEISQKQFISVLEKALKDDALRAEWVQMCQRKGEGLEKVEDYLSLLTEEKDGEGNILRGDDYPIFKLGANDAVFFCKALQKIVAGTRSEVVSYEFRLPTLREWQYASRGRQKPDEAPQLTYFNKWPPLPYDENELFKDKDPKEAREVRDDFNKFWGETVGMTGTFDGTQEKLMEYLHKAQKKYKEDNANQTPLIRGYDYLDAFLKLAYGDEFKQSFHDMRRGVLRKVHDDEKSQNGFGLRHTHGGVARWALDARDDWTTLANGGEKELYCCGGHFARPNTLNNPTWEWFTILGNPEDKDDPEDSIRNGFRLLKYKEAAKRLKAYRSENVGIQPILKIKVSENWLAKVHDTTTSGKVKDPVSVAKEIERFDKGLSELKNWVNKEVSDEADRRVRFYKGLLEIQGRDRNAGANAIRNWAEEIHSQLKQNDLPSDLEGRLEAIGEEVKALKAVAPNLSGIWSPRVRLYRGLLRYRGGQEEKALEAVKQWRDQLRQAGRRETFRDATALEKMSRSSSIAHRRSTGCWLPQTIQSSLFPVTRNGRT